MSAVNINDLRSQVARLTTLKESIKAALAAQAQAIKDAVAKANADDAAANDATNASVQAAIDTAVAEFSGDNDEIVTAVSANVPTEPATPVDPNVP